MIIDHARDRRLVNKALALTNVGPDPVKWIERLRDVNSGSSFTPRAKALIDSTLATLIPMLEIKE